MDGEGGQVSADLAGAQDSLCIGLTFNGSNDLMSKDEVSEQAAAVAGTKME